MLFCHLPRPRNFLSVNTRHSIRNENYNRYLYTWENVCAKFHSELMGVEAPTTHFATLWVAVAVAVIACIFERHHWLPQDKTALSTEYDGGNFTQALSFSSMLPVA
jgi:hypothetical protein